MIALDDFESLKRKVDKLKEAKSKASGAFDQILKRLRKEFGCKTLKEGKKLLERLKKEEHEAHTKYLKAKKLFRNKWSLKTIDKELEIILVKNRKAWAERESRKSKK